MTKDYTIEEATKLLVSLGDYLGGGAFKRRTDITEEEQKAQLQRIKDEDPKVFNEMCRVLDQQTKNIVHISR